MGLVNLPDNEVYPVVKALVSGILDKPSGLNAHIVRRFHEEYINMLIEDYSKVAKTMVSGHQITLFAA